MTCDCNSDYDDDAMILLRTVFNDVWDIAGVGSGRTSVGADRRIDYVLIGKQSGVPVVSVSVDYTGGLSDHYPVTADL